jgi:hypothetical protein
MLMFYQTWRRKRRGTPPPRRPGEGLPVLTSREWADLPPYHPPTERN